MYFFDINSAITDLTIGGHFAQKFNHFCLYLPEALINLLKHGTIINILLNETT